MPAAERTKVYHIPGRLVVGIPMLDQHVDSKAEADRLVATGAFAHTEKEAHEQAYSTPAATPATDANVKKQPAAPAPAEE